MSIADAGRKGRHPPRAVVLGDTALEQLPPCVARLTFRPLLDRVVICAPETDPAVVVGWRAAGFGRVVAPSDLVATVMRLAPTYVRPQLAPSEWLGPAALQDDDMALAAEALPTLPRVAVSDWRDALGCSYSAIERLTRRACGRTPRQVLDLYEQAACERLRRDGAGLDDIACALGRSEASSVSHMLRRVRVRAAGAATHATTKSVNSPAETGHSGVRGGAVQGSTGKERPPMVADTRRKTWVSSTTLRTL